VTLAALTAGLDADALGAGFALLAFLTCVFWWALLGLNLLRRLLSEAS